MSSGSDLFLQEAILMDRSFLSRFRLYDGSGDLAEQHISNFEIASGDTAHDESLLLKHFSASLSGSRTESLRDIGGKTTGRLVCRRLMLSYLELFPVIHL